MLYEVITEVEAFFASYVAEFGAPDVALLPEYEVRLEASELSLGVAVSAYIFARLLFQAPLGSLVITSYSIHYTKLYEPFFPFYPENKKGIFQKNFYRRTF